MTDDIEVSRSLRASTVGILPCIVVLFRKGNTMASVNS